MSASFVRTVKTAAICLSCTALLAQQAAAQTTAPTPPSTPPSVIQGVAPASQAAPTTAPVVPINQSTPRGALKSLVTAMQAGDGEKIKNLIATTNPTEDRMVTAMAAMSVSEKKFRTAAETAFGATAKDLTGDTEAGAAEGMAKIDASQERINGDKATVDGAAPDGVPPLTLQKVGDAWRIPISELARGVDPATINQRLDDLTFMSKMMDESADEVTKGVYKTPKDAGDAIKNKMMVAMMKRAATSQPTTGAAPGDPSSPPTPPPAPSTPAAPDNGM